MSLIDSTFMESYRQNVMITGGDGDLESMFEGATPISYEDAIAAVYEIQYSVEAMAIMNENAFMMESAGAAMLNEGIVGNFISAAVDKIKELIQKVKDFVVAIIKKIQDFFRELYAKATPIDKAMQMYGKKPVEASDIATAISNGLKIPGSLWLVADEHADATTIASETFNKGSNTYDNIMKNLENLEAASSKLTFRNNNDSEGNSPFKAQIERLKEDIKAQKEKDKENFTWVGQLLSDNDTYTKKEFSKQFMIRAGKDGKKENDVVSIPAVAWKATSNYALYGQSKMRQYENEVRKDVKLDIKMLENMQKSISKLQTNNMTSAQSFNNDQITQRASESKANVNSYVSVLVQAGTYFANRRIMILQRVVLPCMRKQHKAAISTYIWITSHVRSAKRKEERKLKS